MTRQENQEEKQTEPQGIEHLLGQDLLENITGAGGCGCGCWGAVKRCFRGKAARSTRSIGVQGSQIPTPVPSPSPVANLPIHTPAGSPRSSSGSSMHTPASSLSTSYQSASPPSSPLPISTSPGWY